MSVEASSDLEELFRLNTTFDPATGIATEIRNFSDRVRRVRKGKAVIKWRNTACLGQGASATVWKQHEEESPANCRAIKQIPKGTRTAPLTLDYRRELLALGRLSKRDDVFVKFLGWYEDARSVYLAMEYFEHGDLGQHLDTVLAETEVRVISGQLLEGLAALHGQNWAHRDLKPPNIFVVDKAPWWVKIGDFGISKRIRSGNTRFQTLIGTADFVAPEVLNLVSEDNSSDTGDDEEEYTVAVDIWSLGCVVFQLLTLETPFTNRRKLGSYCRSPVAKFPNEALERSGVSTAAKGIIHSFLEPLPSQRITADEALRLDWICGAGDLPQSESVPEDSIVAAVRPSVINTENKNTELDHMSSPLPKPLSPDASDTTIQQSMTKVHGPYWDKEEAEVTNGKPPLLDASSDPEQHGMAKLSGASLMVENLGRVMSLPGTSLNPQNLDQIPRACFINAVVDFGFREPPAPIEQVQTTMELDGHDVIEDLSENEDASQSSNDATPESAKCKINTQHIKADQITLWNDGEATLQESPLLLKQAQEIAFSGLPLENESLDTRSEIEQLNIEAALPDHHNCNLCNLRNRDLVVCRPLDDLHTKYQQRHGLFGHTQVIETFHEQDVESYHLGVDTRRSSSDSSHSCKNTDSVDWQNAHYFEPAEAESESDGNLSWEIFDDSRPGLVQDLTKLGLTNSQIENTSDFIHRYIDHEDAVPKFSAAKSGLVATLDIGNQDHILAALAQVRLDELSLQEATKIRLGSHAPLVVVLEQERLDDTSRRESAETESLDLKLMKPDSLGEVSRIGGIKQKAIERRAHSIEQQIALHIGVANEAWKTYESGLKWAQGRSEKTQRWLSQFN